MRRIKLVLAMAAVVVATLIVTAGPAMADHTNRHEENRQERLEDRWDWWEDHHHGDVSGADIDDFGFFLVDEVDVDVDEEEVGPRNDLEGECFVEEIDWDLDGFIAEWEIDIVCFV